jgi:hypothetical protein
MVVGILCELGGGWDVGGREDVSPLNMCFAYSSIFFWTSIARSRWIVVKDRLLDCTSLVWSCLYNHGRGRGTMSVRGN